MKVYLWQALSGGGNERLCDRYYDQGTPLHLLQWMSLYDVSKESMKLLLVAKIKCRSFTELQEAIEDLRFSTEVAGIGFTGPWGSFFNA